MNASLFAASSRPARISALILAQLIKMLEQRKYLNSVFERPILIQLDQDSHEAVGLAGKLWRDGARSGG